MKIIDYFFDIALSNMGKCMSLFAFFMLIISRCTLVLCQHVVNSKVMLIARKLETYSAMPFISNYL